MAIGLWLSSSAHLAIGWTDDSLIAATDLKLIILEALNVKTTITGDASSSSS